MSRQTTRNANVFELLKRFAAADERDRTNESAERLRRVCLYISILLTIPVFIGFGIPDFTAQPAFALADFVSAT